MSQSQTIKSSNDDFVLEYEDMKPKRGKKKMTNTTREVYANAFDNFNDAQLIAGIAQALYKRHKAGLWMSIAGIELVVIVWMVLA